MAAIPMSEWSKTVKDPLRLGLILTQFKHEPFFGLIPIRTVKGLSLPYNQEETLPQVAFRNINEAFTPTYGVINQLIEVLKPLGGESLTDTELINAYGMQERTTRDRRFAKSISVTYVETVCYGNDPNIASGAYVDAKGFDGLTRRITAGQTVDVTGTGSACSSIFAIKFGDDEVQGLAAPGNVRVNDLGLMQSSPAMGTRIEFTAGLAIYDGRSVARAKNITVAAPITRVLMDNLASKIRGKPSLYLMTDRSQQQLKDSMLGAGVALGLSMDELGNVVETYGGVPIYTTEAMVDTEAAT